MLLRFKTWRLNYIGTDLFKLSHRCRQPLPVSATIARWQVLLPIFFLQVRTPPYSSNSHECRSVLENFNLVRLRHQTNVENITFCRWCSRSSRSRGAGKGMGAHHAPRKSWQRAEGTWQKAWTERGTCYKTCRLTNFVNPSSIPILTSLQYDIKLSTIPTLLVWHECVRRRRRWNPLLNQRR